MSKTPKSKKSSENKPLAVEMPTNPTPDINAINEKLALIGVDVRQAFDLGDFATAKHLLETEVLPHTPQHPIALNDLAIAEKMLGNHQLAYNLAAHSLNFANESHLPEIYDNLASICHRLNRFEESKHFGRLAIYIKKESIKDIAPNELPKRKKKALSTDKTKNIIAFSLFGNDPRQCETAVLNAPLANALYPDWTARFYVDDNVPEHAIDRLNQHGVEIVKVSPDSNIPSVLRHFAVLADPEVHAFLLRDCDSLLSQKEVAAVSSWLESKQHFHIMRDFYEHNELVLPSMWGGYAGGFDNIMSTMSEFFAKNGIGRTTILAFLRTKIYPTLAQSLISHDDLHLDPDSFAYPRYIISDIERIPHFHIGMADAFVQTTNINPEESVAAIEWYLGTKDEQIVCYYTSPTQKTPDGKTVVSLNLPYFYGQNIQSGLWQVHYQTAQ